MTRTLLAISFCAIFATACGGSSSSGGGTTPDDSTTPDGGTNPGDGTNPDGGTDPGEGPAGPVGGQTGSFGDSALAANGIDASTTVCPATVTGSFTGWVDLGQSWCVWRCPADAVNTDSGDFGFIEATGESCRDTNADFGSVVTAAVFAPINGCPAGGCNGASEFFPQVFISATASNADLANTYNCQAWLFDEIQQIWVEDTSPAPFGLALAADGSATVAGTPTTWSFDTGTLLLETGLTLDNVSVGNGSFSSWNSNTSLLRCQ